MMMRMMMMRIGIRRVGVDGTYLFMYLKEEEDHALYLLLL